MGTMKTTWGTLATLALLAGCGQSPLNQTAAKRSAVPAQAQAAATLAPALQAADAAAFAAADRNADGALSAAELPQLPGTAFTSLDGNRDSRLSFAEATSQNAPMAARVKVAGEFADAPSQDTLEAPLGAAGLAEAIDTAAEPATQVWAFDGLSAKPKGNPVVFVPGYLDLEVYFGAVKKKLRAQGRTTHYLALFPNISDITAKSQMLKAHIDKVKQETGAKQVDILAHSMGGLVTRYYLKHLDGEQHVERLVTLATPNHGTILGHVGPGMGADQMRPRSSFLDALNSPQEAPHTVKYLSIRGGWDEIIIPHSSPICEGAENRLAPRAMHGSIFLDRKAWGFMQEGLNR